MSRSLRRSLGAGALAIILIAGIQAPVGADPYTDIRARIDEGRLRDAQDAAVALTTANPADCRAWLLLGEARRRLTRIESAIGAYREGLKACPQDKDLLRALGAVLDETERYDDLVKVYGDLWALDPSDPLIGSRLGAAAYRTNHCQEGRGVYQALLNAHPDRTTDRLAYAQLLARACRDFAAADAEYQALLAKNPADATVHCARTYMLAAAGRTDDAVKAAEAGLAAVKENTGCLYAAWGRALEAGGDSLMVGGKVPEARDLYQKALAPLQQGAADPLFGSYCQAIISEVRYKEAPIEELKP
jgi:tetratricopeptide (TPR) repeat protein